MKNRSLLFRFKARAGFGLMEVMIAAIIMAGTIYAGTTMVQNLSTASKRVEGSTEFSGLYSSINQLLSKTDICTDVLRNVDGRNLFPGAVGAKAPVTVFMPSPSTEMVVDGRVDLTKGKTPYINLILTKFELEKLKAMGGNGWSAKLSLEVIRRETPTVPLRKEFFMNVGIDPITSKITTCEAGIEKDTIQAAACGGFSANYDQNAAAGDVCSFKSGTAASPSIKFSFGGAAPFTHDSDTGLFSPLQNSVAFSAGGRESLRIVNNQADSAGTVGRVLTNYNFASAAGNARGPAATDLQSYRENADEVASGWFSTLLGGYKNKASGHYSFVGGGSYEYATGDNSVSVGGWANTAAGSTSGIVSGYGNSVAAGTNHSSILGGWRNTVNDSWAVIVGGGRNVVNARFSAIVAGGSDDVAGWGPGANQISGIASFIGTGGNNNITGAESGIVSGDGNYIDGSFSIVGAGMNNRVKSNSAGALAGEGLTADGFAQTVLGRYNVVPNSSSKTNPVDTDLLLIIGNGHRNGWPTPPSTSNAFTVNGLGDTWAAGNITAANSVNAASAAITNAVTANSVTAVTVTQTSDRRLKEKISFLDSMIAKIKKLKPVNYFWKDKEKNGADRQIGFIAQDVEEVFPEAVRTDEKGMKSVNYGALVAPLTKTVQEQQATIEAQQRQIEEMRSLLCSMKPEALLCKNSH